MNNNDNGTKLLLTFIIVVGLIVAAVYFMRSRKPEQEPEVYRKHEVIKEETKETMYTPDETVTETETEQTQTEIK